MKKIILIFLFPVFSLAQLRINETEYFTISVINDPRASIKEGGFYIGAELEYVGKIYTRIGIDNFAILQDGYTAVIGGIGINLTSGYFEKIRYYAGVRLGAIKRAETNATAGLEAGIDFSIGNNAFIGIRTSYDYRSDQEFYDYPNSMKNSGYIRFGIRF